MGSNAWRIAFRISGWVVGALLVVLAVTGIALTFRYRPEQQWFGYANVQSLETSGPGLGLRWVHRMSGTFLFPAILAFVIAAIGLLVQRHRPVAIALPVVAGIGVVVAGITGYLLPWDVLAMTTVTTVGTNIRGYTDILGNNDVKYVLVGGTEVSASSFTRTYWLHAAVLPLCIIGLVVATFFAARRSGGSEEAVVGEVGAGPQGAELLPHE